MPYDDHSEYPRGLYTADLSVDREVFADGVTARVASVTISNADVGAATVVLQTVGGTADIAASLIIPPGNTRTFPGFLTEDGLEVAMAVNSANVTVFITYWDA